VNACHNRAYSAPTASEAIAETARSRVPLGRVLSRAYPSGWPSAANQGCRSTTGERRHANRYVPPGSARYRPGGDRVARLRRLLPPIPPPGPTSRLPGAQPRVLAVTVLLTGVQVGLGLGLGLFGILSIIRLRSEQLTQEEVAYYFIALALGLVNGLRPVPGWLAPAVSAVLVGAMYVADHPRIGARSHRQLVTLDAAYLDRADLLSALHRLLGAEIRHAVVLEIDLVRDVTVVDVRFRTPRPRRLSANGTRRLERLAS
jgi:hypothetical protein